MTVRETESVPRTVDSSRPHGTMTAYLLSKAVFVGLETGVFEALHTAPAAATELAGRLGIEFRPVRAVPTALRGLDLVTLDGDVYRNAEEAERQKSARKSKGGRDGGG